LVQTNAEIFPSYVATQTATNAYKLVLSDVGCNLPVPDVIDRRVIGEVLDGTTHYEGTNGNPYIINGVVQDTPRPNYPGIIDSQTTFMTRWARRIIRGRPPYNDLQRAGGFRPRRPAGLVGTHSGTNPNSAAGDFSDANADLEGDGYTELERYLNWLAAPHYDCLTGTP
jgi:hypothetical protein